MDHNLFHGHNIHRYRLYICENILTIKCPRPACGNAIFDFDGCVLSTTAFISCPLHLRPSDALLCAARVAAHFVPGAWPIAATTPTITCASAPAMPEQARSLERLISSKHITGNGAGMRCSNICSRYPQTMRRRCGGCTIYTKDFLTNRRCYLQARLAIALDVAALGFSL